MCLLLLEAADRDALRFLSVLLLEDLLTLLVVGESVPKPSVVGELVLADLTLFEDLADLLLTSPSVGESVAKLSGTVTQNSFPYVQRYNFNCNGGVHVWRCPPHKPIYT